MSTESLIAPLSPAKSLTGWVIIIDASAYTDDMNSAIPNSFHLVAGVPAFGKIANIVRELNCVRVGCLVAKGYHQEYEDILSAHGIENSSESIDDLIPRDIENCQVMVVRGDMPLMTKQTMLKLAGQHELMQSALTLLTLSLIQSPSPRDRG